MVEGSWSGCVCRWGRRRGYSGGGGEEEWERDGVMV